MSWRYLNEPLGINDLEMQTTNMFSERSMEKIKEVQEAIERKTNG